MTELDSGLRRVLERMTDGILAVDQQGHIVFANQALEAMSGYPRGDLLTMSVEDLVPATEREIHQRNRQRYHLAASPPRPMGVGLDIRLRRQDGSEFPADVALSPIQTAGDLLIVVAAVRGKAGPPADLNQDPEARRLERDIHERALQTLFGLSLNLQTLSAQLSDQALSTRLDDAVQQVEDVVRDLRNYIFGLRPGILSHPAPGPEDG